MNQNQTDKTHSDQQDFLSGKLERDYRFIYVLAVACLSLSIAVVFN